MSSDFVHIGSIGYFKYWCQKVLPAVYDDSLSYYELLCKVCNYLNELIEVTNTQSDAITELQELVKSFLDGEIDPYIEDKIDQWFIENEPEIMNELSGMQTNIEHLSQISGFKYKTVEIFHDDTTARNSSANTWTYLSNNIFVGWSVTTHNSGNSGWRRQNDSGQTALAFMNSECSSMTLDYRKTVELVILQFGYYDIYGTNNIDEMNYETMGRTIVNRAKNLFPNAVIVVYPMTDKCYGHSRAYELNFAALQYGMKRSSVPLYMVDWNDAFIANKMQPTHYTDDTDESGNPYILNGGGTNTIGALIKMSILGGNYKRETRLNITAAENTTWNGIEVFLLPDCIHAGCTSGRIDVSADFNDGDTVGSISTPFYMPAYDIPLGIICYHGGGAAYQVVGYLNLSYTTGEIVFRSLDQRDNPYLRSGHSYYLMSNGSWSVSFINRF